MLRAAHDKTMIRMGDRHDLLLRRLLGGANWMEENPAYCRRDWHTAPSLASLSGSLAISTDLSTCRFHFAARWPGWTIHNEQTLRDGVRHSRYRIMSLAELTADAYTGGPIRTEAADGAGLSGRLHPGRQLHRAAAESVAAQAAHGVQTELFDDRRGGANADRIPPGHARAIDGHQRVTPRAQGAALGCAAASLFSREGEC